MWKAFTASVVDHFEVVFIVLSMISVFAFGAIMLARWPMSEEMGRWVEQAGMGIEGFLASKLGGAIKRATTPPDPSLPPADKKPE